MPQCWLKPNRRPLIVAMALPTAMAIAGAILMLVGWRRDGTSAIGITGACMLALGGIGATAMGVVARIPRLAYDDGELLVYLRWLTPLRVPIDLVECFFLGQGPAHPAAPDEPVAKAANVIARIAESAPQWHKRRVRADLGDWRDGYVTIRGMWCEPLSHERVNELNRQLAQAHRARRTQQEAT